MTATILLAVIPLITSDEVLKWVVAVGLGGVIVEVIRVATQRKKMSADAAQVITQAAAALVTPMQARITQLEPLVEKVSRLEALVDSLTRELDRCQTELELVRQENILLRARQDGTPGTPA
jgi:tetrahydromethanopterin S-methyltransferase subunit B